MVQQEEPTVVEVDGKYRDQELDQVHGSTSCEDILKSLV